jgi:hypothetical protein
MLQIGVTIRVVVQTNLTVIVVKFVPFLPILIQVKHHQID